MKKYNRTDEVSFKDKGSFMEAYLQDLRERTAICKEPVGWTTQKRTKYLRAINDSPINTDTWHLAFDITRAEFIRFDSQTNIEKKTAPGLEAALGYKNDINFLFFLEEIVADGALAFYLKSGLKMYEKVLTDFSSEIKPYEHSYKTYLTLKDKKGEFWFMSQSSIPMEVDSKGKLISHHNIYKKLFSVEQGKMTFKIGGIYHKELFQESLTESFRDDYEQHIFEAIKMGLKSEYKDGEAIWRCLYEYLYRFSQDKSGTAWEILNEIMSDDKTPKEIKTCYESGYNSGESTIVRKNMSKVRDYIEKYFFISQRDTDSLIPFLRENNRYFRGITTPYGVVD